MILTMLLVLAIVILVGIVIALAFPKSAPGLWIAQAFKDVWTFVYTEVGTLLSIFKYPVVGSSPTILKWSTKRLVSLGLILGSWLVIGVPRDWYQVITMGIAFVIAGLLLWKAMETKT